MDVQLVSSDEDLNQAAEVLLQLRPQYETTNALIAAVREQQEAGYQLACVKADDGNGEDRVISVAGFVITEKLAWGKSLYVDDLVTDSDCRSLGAGKAMISWLKQFARKNSCRELHLDSGMHRKDAHRFYDREGFNRASLHFSITDLES